jgi:hypothetical protein
MEGSLVPDHLAVPCENVKFLAAPQLNTLHGHVSSGDTIATNEKRQNEENKNAN